MAYCSDVDRLSSLPRVLDVSESSDDDDELSRKIQSYYEAHKQTETQLQNKENTRKSLEDLFHRHLHSSARVTIVGSTLTAFATSSSNLDIILTAAIDLASGTVQSKVHAILKDKSGMTILEFRNGPTVKVPIIGGYGLGGNVKWQMSFNQTDGIVKTKLLRAYSLLDDRVAPIVLTIKDWAEEARVKNARDGTLSSYSWTLMSICYLQSGCGSSAVIPCLQKLHPSKYGDGSEASSLSIDIMESAPAFTSSNRSSLGKLLKGFFHFYTNTFKYTSDAVSVRDGCLIPKLQLYMRQPRQQWKFFCIEEPYGTVRSNTARAMFRLDPCIRVITALKEASTQLSKCNTLNPPLAA